MDSVTELLGGRRVWMVGSERRVVRHFAIGAPVPLVLARIRVKYNHPMVAVPIGDINFIRLSIDENFCGQPQVLNVVTPFTGSWLSDLHQEFTVLSELHDHAVMEISLNACHWSFVGSRALRRLSGYSCCSSSSAPRACGRSARCGTPTVAANPNIPFVVDGDAVIGIRPLIAFPFSAPMVKQVSGLVEFENRRRRNAALRAGRIRRRIDFLFFQRSATMNNPHMILRVDRHADGVT